MFNIKESIINNFKKNIINLNGIEYVNADILTSAVSEIVLLESLIGTYMTKNNITDIECNDDDINKFLSLSKTIDVSCEETSNKISLK